MSIFTEFLGLTNKEAYEHAFLHRFLLRTPKHQNEFLGNTQRADFLPYLKKQLQQLPPHSQILDVGAGAGEIVEFALSELDATIHLEEPNEIFLKQYIQRISNYKNLKLGEVYHNKLQELYFRNEIENKLAANMDLILSIHMLYHLTDFTSIKANPETDLIEAIQFMYSLLKPGASIFLVYANNAISAVGKATISAYLGINAEYAQVIQQIYETRNRLLLEKEIIGFLDETETIQPKIVAICQASAMYGSTLEDLAAMCLISELIPANDELFDINKLYFSYNYLRSNPQDIGLCQEERDIYQKGMYRVNQPQVICIIKKEFKNNV